VENPRIIRMMRRKALSQKNGRGGSVGLHRGTGGVPSL
jgi:hypothetical protein